MLCRLKTWEGRFNPTGAVFKEGGARPLLPGCLLGIAVARSRQYAQKRLDLTWMRRFRKETRANGVASISTVAKRVDESEGQVIAIARISRVLYLKRGEAATLSDEQCKMLGVCWSDSEAVRWRNAAWTKKPQSTLCIFQFEGIVELQTEGSPLLSDESVVGTLRFTPAFISQGTLRQLRKCQPRNSLGTEKV
tara:strand:- start:16 stop:594 length:579 start_codon:yes stop_codon:yes gene_type:complete